MMEYEKVSLGFAEFTAKLIEESFEAILSSRQYQLQRYQQLIDAIDNDREISGLVSAEDVEEEVQARFGGMLTEGTVLSNEVSNRLVTYDEILNFRGGEKLTLEAEQLILKVVGAALYRDKVSVLTSLVNQSELPQLRVTEGELITKLELSNFMPTDTSTPDPEDAGNLSKKATPTRKTAKNVSVKERSTNLTRQTLASGLMLDRIKDPETGGAVVMVSKGALEEFERQLPVASIPKLRLIAKPASQTSNSSMLASLKLNFKMV